MRHEKCQCGQFHGGTFPTAGPGFSRRQFFRIAGTGLAGWYFTKVLRPLEAIAGAKATTLDTARYCIFILLAGAPSHIDTFDLKEGPWTPSDFEVTPYNGIKIPRGLFPNLSEQLQHIAILRSVLSWGLVHQVLQVWTQISRNPTAALGNISPHMGAVVALEYDQRRKPDDVLPGFVALNPAEPLIGAGYFSAKYSPFSVVPNASGLADLVHPEGQARFEARWELLQALDGSLRENSPLGKAAEDMADFYDAARGLMYNPTVTDIFKFTQDERARYGNSAFGDACIVARNLVMADKGTHFIQITLGGWDHHSGIYNKQGVSLYSQCRQLDPGLANLITDLLATPSPRREGKTLLDETLIVAMGEFGRTPGPLNGQNGRDHYQRQFVLFAGGGVKGGRAIGATDEQGDKAIDYGWGEERDIRTEDVTATIYSALGIDWTTIRRDDPVGRGFEYVPFANFGVYKPIDMLFRS